MEVGNGKAVNRRSFGVGFGFGLLVIFLVGAIGYWVWLEREESGLPSGIVASIGILGALQIPVASGADGTVTDVAVKPGAMLSAGTVLLRLNSGDRQVAIVTPHAGRADSIAVVIGDKVEQGKIVAVMTDIADLSVTAPFPMETGGAISIGAEARLLFREFRDTWVPARVSAITPPEGGVDLTSGKGRSLTVTVDVRDTRNLQLRPGQRARVYVRTREGAPWPTRLR